MVDTVCALGIDVGTTNTKVALVDVGERSVADRAVAHALTPETAEQLVATVVGLVREVLSGAVRAPAAVGLASMAETGVPLDATGRPLTSLLRWDGHRAAEEAAALTRQHGRLELFRATGVRPSAKVPLATLAWLRAHEPEAFGRMAGWAGAADLIALALTGELITDHTLAGRTMAYRLPPEGTGVAAAFDEELLALVGLVPGRLPRVAHPHRPAGTVLPAVGGNDQRSVADPRGRFWSGAAAAFRAAGLPSGTPVVVAGHDHAVAAWAGGARAPGDRADSIGTAEAVLTILPGDPSRSAQAVPAGSPSGQVETPKVRPARVATANLVADAGMSWVRTPSGEHDALLAGSSSAGAMIGWLASQLRPLSDGDGSADPGALFDAVAADLSRDPTPTGVVVLPYASGRQSPCPDPFARPVVRPPEPDPVRLARAVLEGLSLQARWMLTEQATLAATVSRARPGAPGPESAAAHNGERGRPVTVLGGPALANRAWFEIKSRVGPGTLRWVTAAEPVATGAALLAAVRAGLLGADVAGLLVGGAGQADGAAGSRGAGESRGAAGSSGANGSSGADGSRGAPSLASLEPTPAPRADDYARMYDQFVAAALG